MTQQGLNLLGLALKAGQLVTGEELVLQSIRKKQAKLVIVATDASDNTKKKLQDKCHYYEIPYQEAYSQAEITHALGKKRTACALVQDGFKKRMVEILQG